MINYLIINYLIINIIYDIISMKGLENIKKVKSPVKPTGVSPNKRNNKSYENFLRGRDEKKEEPRRQLVLMRTQEPTSVI